MSLSVVETFNSEIGGKTYPIQAKFYRDLERHAVLIKTFTPGKGKTPGPILLLYKLKTGTELSFGKAN